MTGRLDMELADVVATERARRQPRPPAAAPKAPVDRTTGRWLRVRAALCPFHGLTISLDEYADLVVGAIRTTNDPERTTLDGSSALGAEEVTA